jgi:hypothetical protein
MRSLFLRGGLAIPVFFTLLMGFNPVPVEGSIVVKPGKLDHFEVSVITPPVAGEYFLVKLEAYDSWGNFITEYTGPGDGFTISVSGEATVTPSTIRARDFSGGTVVKIVNEKAEEIELSILEEGGSVPITTFRVVVRPNKLDHFQVTTPRQVTAGEAFQTRVLARDAFENLITDYSDGGEIRLEFMGEGTARTKGSLRGAFDNGEAILDLVAENSGSLTMVVRDSATNSVGRSVTMKVIPADPDHFVVVAPRSAVAGEKFPLTITVFDRFENPITNFDGQDNPIMISSTTGGAVAPATIEPSVFKEGKAVVDVTYEKSESFKILVEGKNKGPRGASETIIVGPADPHHFVLITPNTAVAGQAFPVTIEARDRFNNLVADFHLVGSEVFLGTDGNGVISPSRVSPSLFQGGKAQINISYSKAEAFNLMAGMKEKPGKERPAAETAAKEVERLEAEKDKKELEHKLKAQREREKALALKAKDLALEARKEVEEAKAREQDLKARQEAEQREQAAKAREEEIRKEEEARKRQAEEERSREAQRKEEEARKEAREKEEKARLEEQRKETALKAREEALETRRVMEETLKEPADAKQPPPMVAKPVTQSLDGISLMEAEKEAMVILNLSGPVSYDVTLSSALAREWIFVNLGTAVVDRDKVSETMAVESSLVGQIRTTDKDGPGVEVAIELLPKNITYTVEQEGQAIVIKISRAQ